MRRILEVFSRHGARPPRQPAAFARKLKEYRQAVGEARGLDALLADLEALGPRLHNGSSYALKVLANLLEQGRVGRLTAPVPRRRRRPNPFQPEDVG